MKLFASALAGALSVATLAAAVMPAGAATDEITPQEQALIEGAKKEGSITVINPTFQERTANMLEAAFRKR
jgi:hypothetical protein